MISENNGQPFRFYSYKSRAQADFLQAALQKSNISPLLCLNWGEHRCLPSSAQAAKRVDWETGTLWLGTTGLTLLLTGTSRDAVWNASCARTRFAAEMHPKVSAANVLEFCPECNSAKVLSTLFCLPIWSLSPLLMHFCDDLLASLDPRITSSHQLAHSW